jgi:hypothetical protein
MNVREPEIKISARSRIECHNGTVININERIQAEDDTTFVANAPSKWEVTLPRQ